MGDTEVVVRSLRGVQTKLGTLIEAVEIDAPGDDFEPDVHARLEVRAGVPEVVAVRIEAKSDGRGLRTADLAAVTVDGLLRQGYGVTGWMTGQADAEASVDGLRRRGRPQVVTEGRLREVARVYENNTDHHPVKAVGERFGIGKRQAAFYVQRARELGLLAPSQRQGRGDRG